MNQNRKMLPSPALAFVLAAVVAAAFALYTRHAWEDYYITFRSSRNLATGHGLVFNVGDRLHTFTSPLGVLLPAVAYLLTFNSSDAAALWIFRLMSGFALGGAAALLVALVRRRDYPMVAGLFVLGALVTDAKTVDFTINGMETGILLLFLAYALWAHLAAGPRQWLHLGAAWAGLMWSRPDSFIYIGLLAAGFWLFNRRDDSGATRAELVRLYVRAGLVTTVLYLPWLLFAWGYYGTPVPHTITAKSGIGGPHTLGGLLRVLGSLPFTPGRDDNTLGHAFLPAYFMIGGWPAPLVAAARALGAACSLLWLWPGLRREARAASFAFLGAHAYLSYFPYFPFPWYLPATTFLAIVALGGLVGQAWGAARWARVPLGLVLALLLTGSAWTLAQCARQLAAQQEYVEDGTRRRIGEWLHAHAAPGDTVFMEPLGYIGYFSGLKTYDFPGMSSREVVRARAQVTNEWAMLIPYLGPRWLVLRPEEAARLEAKIPGMLARNYQPVATFDRRAEVLQLDIRGRNYLWGDAAFTVYRSERPMRFFAEIGETVSPFPVSRRMIDSVGVTLIHAPGSFAMTIPAQAETVSVQFGYPPEAYAPGGEQTDGAIFSIELVHEGRDISLVDRQLDPAANPADRGLQKFELPLPPHSAGDRLVFRTKPGATMVNDWTCWTVPEFR